MTAEGVTMQEDIEELKEYFEEVLEKVNEEGMTPEERVKFHRLALTIATDELYRIEKEYAPEDEGVVDPRIMVLLRQIAIVLHAAGDAEELDLVDPKTGEPIKRGMGKEPDEG